MLFRSDISESKHLLWELVTYEPTLLQCFGVVQSTCLSQGVHCSIDGTPCSRDFQLFVDKWYVRFAQQAIRAFFTYGFAPYVIRKLDSGDEIPEILPHGTFHWYTEVPPRNKGGVRQQTDCVFVVYRVKITAPLDVKDEDVIIFPFTPPTLDV